MIALITYYTYRRCTLNKQNTYAIMCILIYQIVLTLSAPKFFGCISKERSGRIRNEVTFALGDKLASIELVDLTNFSSE